MPHFNEAVERFAEKIDLDREVRLPDIDALLELINDGSYDDHIEAILAAGHARKRARRGVRRPYGMVETRFGPVPDVPTRRGRAG